MSGVNMYLSKSRAGQIAAVTPLLSVLREEQLAVKTQSRLHP